MRREFGPEAGGLVGRVWDLVVGAEATTGVRVGGCKEGGVKVDS